MVKIEVWEVILEGGTSRETLLIPWSNDEGEGAIMAGKLAMEEIDKEWPEEGYIIVSIRMLLGAMPLSQLIEK